MDGKNTNFTDFVELVKHKKHQHSCKQEITLDVPHGSHFGTLMLIFLLVSTRIFKFILKCLLNYPVRCK